jgi:hypothetical protein
VSSGHEYQQFAQCKLGNPKFHISLYRKCSPERFEHKRISAHVTFFSCRIKFLSKMMVKSYGEDHWELVFHIYR